jgi:hypothetical protein
VEVRLRDGTVLEATSYTLTGSYVMLTLADGRQIAYDVADVDVESLRSQEPAAEAPPPEAAEPSLSQGRRSLTLPSTEEKRGGLVITDQDVEHVRGTGEAAEPGEEEGEEGAEAAAGPDEGYQTGGRVVLDHVEVTPEGEGSWQVRGEVFNGRDSPVINVRVQLQTIAPPGETPWSSEVMVTSQLGSGERGVFSQTFEAAKPENKAHPDVRASVYWMEPQGERAPQRPPAASAAPTMPGGGEPIRY